MQSIGSIQLRIDSWSGRTEFEEDTEKKKMVEEEICKERVCLGGIFLAGVGLGQILVLSGKCALTGQGTVALGFFLLFIYLFFQRLAAVVTSVEEKVNFSCSCSYSSSTFLPYALSPVPCRCQYFRY